MKKVVTIIGARPQYIKSFPVSVALNDLCIEEILVDTGQHYDYQMSEVFVNELQLNRPSYNLNVGSGSHANMTAKILQGAEGILKKVKPDMTIVYGDTNSTLAGSLASSKLNIPIAHIESGLRSDNFRMPEEINRKVTDHISNLCLCPTISSMNNLEKEGILPYQDKKEIISIKDSQDISVNQNQAAINIGDVMVDSLYSIKKNINKVSNANDEYVLLTMHRADTVDNEIILKNLVEKIINLSKQIKIIFPLHPRTESKLKEFGIYNKISSSQIECFPPFSYIHNMQFLSNATALVTDSGGMQKEAAIMGVPCFTLRDETEWVETVENGWNVLVGYRNPDLMTSIENFKKPKNNITQLFGDGKSSIRIANIINQY